MLKIFMQIFQDLQPWDKHKPYTTLFQVIRAPVCDAFFTPSKLWNKYSSWEGKAESSC